MTTIEEFNRRLGEALGCNPHGEPLYKWFHTDSWMHWMKKLDTMREARTPGGLIVMEPVYIERLMCPAMRGRWMIGHWHDAGAEFEWHQKHGTDQLWPAKGYYVQTNAWCDPGQDPTYTENEKIIMLVRRMRGMTAQEDADIVQAQLDREEKQAEEAKRDFLDDLLPTYGHVPGIRGGHVSYPSAQAAK